MLGLFKDFGKKATDLNKKEFYDAKFQKKATFKASADGVKFESFIQAGEKDSKAEFKLDFKDGDMEIKNKIDKAADYTMEGTCFNVMDGADFTMKLEAPAGHDKVFSTATPGLNYATADLNSSMAAKLDFSDGLKYSFDSRNAFKAMDDLTVGFNLLGLSPADAAVKGVKVGATYNCGDMLLAGFANGSFTETVKDDDKPKEKGAKFHFGAVSGSMFQKVNNEFTVAAEASYGRSYDDRDSDLVIKGDDSFSCKIGTSYALSAKSTLKAKLTTQGAFDSKSLDAAWIQKLSGNSSATIAWNFSDGTTPKMSVAYTLDA